MQVYLNGTFVDANEARVSVFDRGFIFGDAIYEVIAAFDGRLFRGPQHLARLDRSLHGVGIPNPFAADGWTALIERLMQANGGGDQTVYVQVTRGTASLETIRDLVPQQQLAPTVFVATMPRKSRSVPAPIQAVTLRDDRWLHCDLKTTSLLPNVLLRQQALARGVADAILIRNGYVSEGTASNIFAVIHGQLVTPPVSDLILHGTTRALIIELLEANGIAVTAAPITEAALREASEIWSTGTVREILPVTRLDDVPVGSGEPGPVWTRAAEIYRHYRDSGA